MHRHIHQRHAATYRQVNVETLVHSASPHQLVALLFDELLRSMNVALAAMDRSDTQAKGAAIGKSIRLIEEGLKAGLDARNGGTLAGTLRTLYDGIIMRITIANLRNDRSMLAEALRLLAPVRQAWIEIADRPAVTGHLSH